MLCYLDFAEKAFEKAKITVREAVTFALYMYSLKRNLTCEEHLDWQHKFGMRVIVKIFFNNKQKEAVDTVRKDALKRDSGSPLRDHLSLRDRH